MADPQTATTLVEWLDDLSVRFLLNLPQSELSSVPRLCFQVEEAQWFYEDFVRPAVAASGATPLPSLPLRQFCLMLFQHCPLLSGYNDAQHIAAYEEFLAYKVRVPVRGAILLDESMDKVVLVRGWKKGSSWSFPRGKINKDEKDLDCAIREVDEETGYDVRHAGLVPDDEKDAKFIDITMREQHMRLFVFRGVPEDTHFEPKTRKEISKIQWYSIKDLPGFKKQKHGQTGDAGNANKFYMVAPFLGQLKKWINLQRKNDAAQPRHTRVTSDGLGIQTATEDEGETEEATPEPAPPSDRRSEDLKRLLSIGGGNPAPASIQPVQNGGPKNDLLAMLKGSAQPVNGTLPPQTPFEQISAFPKEPETPHQDHMRRPSMPPQQQPPQYPISPPPIQQEQQRNYSLPTPQIFGPGLQFGMHPLHQQQHHGLHGMPPPHIQQQQFHQRQNVPNMPFGQANSMPFNGVPPQQVQPPAPQQHRPMQPPFQQQMPHAYMVQGSQGPIASGPSAPNPSQLPAPRLNTHHLNLLNAFKSGNPAAASMGTSAQPASRHGSTHQAALLDLFRKPSTSQAPLAHSGSASAAEQAASPTLTDVTEKPRPPKQERKPTLNEITRTLPLKPKVKSPPPPSTGTAPPIRPASGQLFDPSSAKPSAMASPHQQPPMTVLQRPASSQSPQPAQAKSSAPGTQSASTRSKANGAPPAPFTILARPASRGLKSPGPVAPPSPLRNQTPQSSSPFQPQVLKRPKSREGDSIATVPEMTPSQQQQARTGDGQKDHLLALFGKASTPAAPTEPTKPPAPAPSAPSPTPSLPPPASSTAADIQANGQRNALLDLLKSPTAPSSQPSAAAAAEPMPEPAAAPISMAPPQPPSAPRLSPSRNPSTQSQTQSQKIHPIRQPIQPPTSHHQQGGPSHFHSRSHNQQNLLLDIFTRPSSSAQQHKRTQTPPVNSPGTPISPFTLGTPVQGQASGFGRQERFGSLASVASSSGGEGKGGAGGVPERKGSLGTPVEAKDREFLMGFLKGVAKGDA